MFKGLIDTVIYMIGRMYNNLDIFISSIIFIVIFGYIVYFLGKQAHKLITKSETRDAKLDILITPLIILFMIISVVVGISGWNNRTITEANIMVAIVSFISPFIAFTGAYALANENHKKSEKIRIENEKNEEVKKELQQQNELEHKKNMLYNMLEYSILQTRISVVEIEEYYKTHYSNDNILPFIEKYNLTGKFLEDFRIMIEVKSGKDCGIFMNYVKQIDFEFSNIIDKHKVSNRVIYIENWYDYLDCVSSTEDVQNITFWINLVKNSDMQIEAYTQKFLSNRIELHEIIKRNYPRAISEGMRGKYSIDLGTK